MVIRIRLNLQARRLSINMFSVASAQLQKEAAEGQIAVTAVRGLFCRQCTASFYWN